MIQALRLSIALFAALSVLALFSDRASAVRVVTGHVLEWHAGQSISIVNDQTDPDGVRIALRATARDEERGAIRTGARVAVWYRTVGERDPVAVKVRVLD